MAKTEEESKKKRGNGKFMLRFDYYFYRRNLKESFSWKMFIFIINLEPASNVDVSKEGLSCDEDKLMEKIHGNS